MSQNLVIPGKDNKVRFVFDGIDLSLANDLQVEFGSESYSLINNTDVVLVESANTLALNLNGTSEKGRVFVTVTYVDAAKSIDITSQILGDVDQVIVALGSQLIVEDGSIVTNANSLGTLEELNAYASLRGYKLPPTQPEQDTLMIKAMDYLFSIEDKLQGVRSNSTQELPFPRIGVCGRNMMISSTVIHPDWKKAQFELAIQLHDSELLQAGSVQNVASEKLGDMEVSYFDNGASDRVQTEKADAYLKPYYKNGGRISLTRV